MTGSSVRVRLVALVLQARSRYGFGVPAASFRWMCGRSSVGRASASQAEGRRFEPGRPLWFRGNLVAVVVLYVLCCCCCCCCCAVVAVVLLCCCAVHVLPLGVTGNTSDSGSEESWFEPRRGNWEGPGGPRRYLERWPSGLRRRPAKAFGPKGSRGFESLPLRSHRWTGVRAA
jgi:hypothetical protein